MATEGTPTNPLPADTGKPEPKVIAATLATYTLGLVLVAVWGGVTSQNLIEDLPDWATAILTPLIPTIGAWIAGYASRHQFRQTAVSGRP